MQLPRKRNLLFSLLLALILVEALAVVALVTSQQINTTEALDRHTHNLLRGIIDEARENAKGFLNEPENAVSLTAGLYRAGLISFDRPSVIERYFLEQLNVVPQIDAIYFGDAQGQFFFTRRQPAENAEHYLTKIIEVDAKGERQVTRILRDDDYAEKGRVVDSTDEFDPRIRPWYRKAKDLDTLTAWTDPYIFFTSKHPGITVAARVRDNDGRFVGVVGADVELYALSRFLAGQKIGRSGAAFVIDGDGSVIAYPRSDILWRSGRDGPLRLARWSELDPLTITAGAQLTERYPVLSQLASGHFDAFTYAKERYLSAYVPFRLTHSVYWIMGAYAPEKEFATAIRKGQRKSVVLGVFISTLAITIVVLLSLLFTRPIRALQRQAFHDPLTGLLNRRGFQEASQPLFHLSRRGGTPFATLMIDIDRFKNINDNFGHYVGDQVLQAVAERIANALSSDDLLARYGGEEFAVLLPGADQDNAAMVAERLRTSVSSQFIDTKSGFMRVTISIGVAVLENSETSLSELLQLADSGLLEAKKQGRNRVVVVKRKATAA